MKNQDTFTQGLINQLIKQKTIASSEGLLLEKSFKESSKEAFDDFLLEEGLVEKEDLLKALSTYYQVPFFDVKGYFFNHLLLQEFPKDVLLRNALIPVEEIDENMLLMVASEPNDQQLLVEIGNCASYDIQFNVGLRLDICDAVKEFYERSLTDIKNDDDIHEELRQEQEVMRMEEEEEEEIIPLAEEETIE